MTSHVYFLTQVFWNKLPSIKWNLLLWVQVQKLQASTVEPQYNDPRYNDIDITMNMLCRSKSYSKMYGTEPRYNDLRYNNIPDITMSF